MTAPVNTQEFPGSIGRSIGQTTASTWKKADAPTMIWHSALLIALAFALLTGLRVANDNAKGGWRQVLEPILMQGDVIRWHAWAALALGGLTVGYLAFLWKARLAARWKVSKVLLRSPSKAARWQALNRALYWVGLTSFALAMFTGVWLYFLPFFGFIDLMALVHEIASWLLIAYMVLHALAQFMMGGIRQLLKVFIPRRDLMQAAAVMMAALVAGVVGLQALDWQATPALHAVRAASAPQLDGRTDDAVWQSAPVAQVMTAHGWNVADGQTPVRARAAVVGDRAYFLFEWKDDTQSFMRMPLRRTATGWERLKGNYEKADVTDYYEDKFAIALSPRNNPFGGAWHFGTQPLDGYPKTTQGRGYHATLDGSYVDLWHWKASRTGPLNQADDSHFGPPVDIDPKQKRYPAGYGQDPKTAGGYEDNFAEKDGQLLPKRLPKDPTALAARLGSSTLTPNDSHPSHYSMHVGDTEPYAPGLDSLERFPVGTLIPALILNGPFQGDRGDVDAVGRWSDGWWHLEVSRKLDTGQKDDVPLRDETYLWFSAFNHNQTRHSWHVVPLRLQLPE